MLTDVLLLQYCVFELGHKPGNEASLRMRLLQAQDDIIDRRTGSSFYHFINDLIAISLFQQSSSIFGAPLQTPEDMYSPALHTQERKPDVDDLFSAHDFDIHIDLPTGPEGMVVVFNNTSVHVWQASSIHNNNCHCSLQSINLLLLQGEPTPQVAGEC